jgi:hypothetical protein
VDEGSDVGHPSADRDGPFPSVAGMSWFLDHFLSRATTRARTTPTTSATLYHGMFHGFLSFTDLLDDRLVAPVEAAAALRAALDA